MDGAQAEQRDRRMTKRAIALRLPKYRQIELARMRLSSGFGANLAARRPLYWSGMSTTPPRQPPVRRTARMNYCPSPSIFSSRTRGKLSTLGWRSHLPGLVDSLE